METQVLLESIEDARQKAIEQASVASPETVGYYNGRVSAYYHAGLMVIQANLAEPLPPLGPVPDWVKGLKGWQ
ncbi:hypothetical protein LCGC14_2397780 [marine sediment metagenome]|uniref:Uncharacterized protein n=1 Tax=marine sediment metagenome TaxID=412755 RepID=A0A0F9CI99_9ZZZZ